MRQSGNPTEAELRQRLAEAEAALAALRSGKADTLIGDAGPLLFQLKSAVEAREQAEAALRESEERNRHISELITDYAYSFLVGPDGAMRGEWVSDSFTRMFGFTIPEIEARGGWQAVVFPEDLPLALAHARKVVGGEKDVCEMRFVTRAGEPRWLRDYAVPVWDVKQGRVVRIYGAAQDITERRRAEEALRRERALLERINTASPAGIVVVNRHGQITFANPQAEKILGLTKEAITQRTYNDLAWHITDLGGGPFPDEELPFRRVLATRQPVTDIRHAIQGPDGRRVLLSVNGAPLLDAAGELEGAAFTVSDITERVQAETALRESEARFREIAETIEEVFWITDPTNTRMFYVSPAYEKIWGRSCASLYASPRAWLEAIHSDDRERLRRATETGLASRDYDETYRIVRPDGALRWIRDRAFPVRNASGEIVRIVGVARDITEHRQLEEQLRQSQKMDAIGQLAGGVAHDFNNILAVIMMQAELTGMAQNLPEEVREGLRQIRAAAERAANLTRQLLLFSRKQVMQSRELDLNDVVTSLAKMLQRIIGEDVRLQLHLHPRPLTIRADAGMLDQVLMNLVVNARDAMPGGGRVVIETGEKDFSAAEVASMPDASPGRHVCLRVADTGSGIAPENLARIFEPFFTTKEPGKGTGLGLATVFGIVKQHGGWITVESAVGQGTTFQVYLPALEAAAAAAAAAARPAPRGGSETILLVEDDASVRALTRHVLERAGYRVLEAANGVEALARAEQHRDGIQLLLTDIVMPEGVSGRELAARLMAGHPKLRVVFISGYSAEIAGRELALRAGQNFLQKPAAPHELLETIRRCLDSPAGGPET
jgi:PAS domain S-box-containing protein